MHGYTGFFRSTVGQICLILFFCLLVHRLTVRIGLPFYMFFIHLLVSRNYIQLSLFYAGAREKGEKMGRKAPD